MLLTNEKATLLAQTKNSENAKLTSFSLFNQVSLVCMCSFTLFVSVVNYSLCGADRGVYKKKK